MDLRERVAKAEAIVESLKHDIDRLYGAIESLREHTDKGFSDMRTSHETSMSELRATQAANMKMQLRLLLAIVAMIAGMLGRMFNLY